MSNDLISRENVTKEISEILADALISGFRRETVSFDDVNHRIQECLKSQPTAYDVDAVVEQLENAMGLCEGFVDSANSEYEADRWTHKAETYGEAIEIVKGGGVDE